MNTMHAAVTKVTRKAKGETVRMLEVRYGYGKGAVTTVLGTEIEKVKMPEKFAKLQGHTAPIEQYGFKIGNFVGERFADAAAVVLRDHRIEIPEAGLDQKQAYVQAAVKIMKGERPLKDVTKEFVEGSNAGGAEA